MENQNIPGLDELRRAREQAEIEQQRYDNEFRRMMESEYNDGTQAPRPVDKSKMLVDELKKKYPKAAVYLRAEGYLYASNIDKYAAGKKAMKILEDGGSAEEAKNILDNWCMNSLWS